MNQPHQASWNNLDGVPTRMPDGQHRGVLTEGVQIGNFTLRAKLGRGGMGEVWQAWDIKGERLVVLKLVPRELQHAAEAMARVKTTFKLVHELNDRNICPLYLLDEDPRFGWYLVMKYIDGQTLSSYRATYVARHGSFPVEQVVKVLRPVAEALDYAHQQRVVHRDIKPQNILVVGKADDVQIVDFGLAAEIRTTVSRLTRMQLDTSGTRPYMAPEQWKGQHQDKATDQYSLAAVAYELLAGRLPFESDDFDILRACVLNDPPEPIAGQSEFVNRAVLIGLAKQRSERFASCLEFVEAIEGAPFPQPVYRMHWEDTEGDFVEGVNRELFLAAEDEELEAWFDLAQRVEPQIQAVTETPKETSNSIGMKMVLIPAGEFWMGVAENEAGAFEGEKPQHRVRITKPFYLGIYPVTQAEYQRVMVENPSKFQGVDRRPVEQVSWEDAVEFCRRLSAQEGMTYRLPTEAEWEYACRAGSTGRWCFGDDESLLEQYAWYVKNSGGSTHPVGQKKPNSWGLYDMHGNVWEWCVDWWDENYYQQFADKVAVDPTGPARGSYRVFRGGSWRNDASYGRASYRYWDKPGYRGHDLGFRLARAVS